MSVSARDYAEKRNFIRMQVHTPATLTLNDGSEYDLLCIDLSSSGAQLEGNKVISEQAEGQLCIQSGGGTTAPLLAEVAVCRVQTIDDKVRIGVNIKRFIA